ncbi:33183_t:CDS:1 [Racocetra persica]|uniref:33183_t:CDS:1 n=1 Tax=Racocetra persica TaxID=160502 RepID=A0ACA9MSF8_9GLOM|nr:33183_t:CDS:1 [Racocetra persica]
MTCNHIKQAKEEILLLIKNLGNKKDKTIHDNKEYVSKEEIDKITKQLEKRISVTTTNKKLLNKTNREISNKSTDVVIDQVAMSDRLHDIYKILEQCNCYNDLKIALEKKVVEVNGLVDRLESAPGNLQSRQPRIGGTQNLVQYNEGETQKLNNKISSLKDQIKALREKNCRYELQIEEEKLERIVRRVGNEEQIYNLRDCCVQAKRSFRPSDTTNTTREIERELSRNIERSEVREIKSCCEKIAELQLKLDQQAWNQEILEMDAHIETPTNINPWHNFN